ncbi:uncharacterized protein PRCAT00001224001 [Priceomyces carsonii]|uniref:uncharacterized protein n=1 Tax=Priceomyces carsonii TaxID=28549 RepID=UPI002EDA7B36|nr:unnamed protein product [Priceomyces carsonii]
MRAHHNRSVSQKTSGRHAQTRLNNNPNEQNGDNDQLGDERLLHLIAKGLGQQCVATVSSGAKYQGLLVNGDIASSGKSQLSVVLRNPTSFGKGLLNETSNVDNDLPETMIIEAKDLVELELNDLDAGESFKKLPSAATITSQTSSDSKFKTDTDISGKTQIKQRELKRWVPDETDNDITFSLEDDNTGNWDQFKANEERFGVDSTYDEHLYTTRIDKSAPDYQQKLERAERLAKEIEGLVSNDRHVLEERGLQIDDSGLDEEDKYSGVDRRGDELMAALRSSSISKDSASLLKGPGKYVPPRQRAAHYHNDPAIISSSAADNTSKKGDPKINVSKSEHNKNQLGTSKPDSIPPKPPVAGQQMESFRLNAQSEINSLREFSANFKIPHKMPTDLLPILTKDKIKQDEILKKQEIEKALKQQENQKSQAARKKLDPSKPAFKLNPKAAAFTPSSKQTQILPNPPKYIRSPNNQASRLNNLRPYSSGFSIGNNTGGNSKRHHQISASEFFGGTDKVPTEEGQKEKTNDFKFAFNLFVTARKILDEKNVPLVFEKTFQTPPTWDYTIDETYDQLFPFTLNKGVGISMSTSPFIQSPLTGTPNIQSGYPTPNGSKYPLSPQQQQAAAAMAAHFQQQQQQQFHAAMMYQQQFGGSGPMGQPPIPMYAAGDSAFLPPTSFIPPPGSFGSSAGSPVNGNLVMGGTSPHYAGQNSHSSYNNHLYHGNRRYNGHHNQNQPNPTNNNKRGGNS